MKAIEPYLFFDGTCKDAMEFYKSCFGGEHLLMTFADSPEPDNIPEGMHKESVMHSMLKSGDLVLMASDGCCSGDSELQGGKTVQLNLNVDTYDSQDELISKLKNGGVVVQEPQEMFWQSRFAIVTDKFGITWMLNCPMVEN